jgi:hypothetical protein
MARAYRFHKWYGVFYYNVKTKAWHNIGYLTKREARKELAKVLTNKDNLFAEIIKLEKAISNLHGEVEIETL